MAVQRHGTQLAAAVRLELGVITEVRDVPAEPAAVDPLANTGAAAAADDPTELLEALVRIAARLDALEQRLG